MDTIARKRKKERKCVHLVVRILRFDSLNSFCVCNIQRCNCSHLAVQYIPSTYLSYNWKFLRFDEKVCDFDVQRHFNVTAAQP